MNDPFFSRRRFVKTFVLGSALSASLGKVSKASVLADIVPANVGLLRVKLSDYPALLQEYGSVRLGLNAIDNPTGPLGFFYPIIINHETANTYYALDSACRHAGCIVPPYSESDGAIICPCHGSGYGIDGRLLNGPASSPLIRYTLRFDGADTLTVEVPFLGYRVTSTLVPTDGTPRLRLAFRTFDGVEYEVKFRQRLSDDWTVVPFAYFADEPPDQLSLFGDSSTIGVFVEQTTPTGFYAVSIRVLDLTEG
jgi:Rieske Fe-S protein